jgi:methyltransferase
MVSELAFIVLVGVVAVQRLWELRKSARHEARLRAAGAVEHAPEQMVWMRLVHALWLFAMPAEVLLLDRRAFLPLTIAALALFALGQMLRLSAIHALGWRWNVRILVLPDRPPIARGIYRYLHHPNYAGVILEIAALPLVHGAWITAMVFSVLNLVLLFFRVRAEDAALGRGRSLSRDAWQT